MGAFEDLLKRQGYVKLDHYGLVLTPDDRILSTRPAVLDDGLGGKIVGWADGDLAAAELDRWGAAAKPAAAKRVAANPGSQSTPPLPPAPPRTARGTAPPVPRVTAMAAVAPAPASAPISLAPRPAPAVVAVEPVVEEDEWEWEIAMARARAVADDVQTAAASIATSFTAPGPRKVAAPKKTMTMPVAASRPLAAGSGPISKATSSMRGFTPGATHSAIRRMAASEDTVVTPVRAANEDRTSPYVTLPPEVKPTGFAHTKRVAAKHR